MKQKCPECKKGRLYKRKEATTSFTLVFCYRCGYYENDSEGYKMNPTLHKELFKKWFPHEVRWTPLKNGHPDRDTHEVDSTFRQVLSGYCVSGLECPKLSGSRKYKDFSESTKAIITVLIVSGVVLGLILLVHYIVKYYPIRLFN